MKKVTDLLRSTFARGLALLVPIAITIWVLLGVFNAMDRIIWPIYERYGIDIPGLGFLTMVVLIFLIGLLSRNLVGKLLFGGIDALMKRLPIVKSLYTAIKEVINAFSGSQGGRSFRQVVVIEYPRPGLHTVGFVTNDFDLARPKSKIGRVVSVYIPNPPNPTSGLMILVPIEEVGVLDMPVEEGLKLALSGGIVAPEVLKVHPMKRP